MTYDMIAKVYQFNILEYLLTCFISKTIGKYIMFMGWWR